MKMNFQERIENRRSQGNLHVSSSDDADKAFDLEYYGIDNMRNSVYSIDLRFANGLREGIDYSHITRRTFVSPEEIVITTIMFKIKIIGRDLLRLYDYLMRHRLVYIQEHTGTDINESGLFVKEILLSEI